MKRNVVKRKVRVTGNGGEASQVETLPRELPFEIQLRAGRAVRSVANITRTPGHDYELAAGLLLGEGFIHSKHDFSHMTYCVAGGSRQEYNLLSVVLHRRQMPEPLQPAQVVVDGVVCGVSSRSLLEALEGRALPPLPEGPTIKRAQLLDAAHAVAAHAQPGLVQAALFDANGTRGEQRTDVDARNAFDKLIGWGVLHDALPFHRHMVFITGNAAFALLQRCAVAGVPLVAISGVPSSLALSVAARFGITLVGVGGEQILVYTGQERIT